MKLPNLPYSDSRMKQAMLAFGGVDYTPGAEPGQWEETENVSCREYPALVPRESREVVDAHDGATALYVYDKIAEVIGTGFYYDGVYKCAVSPGRKQITTVGNLIIIYPDKIYYNMDTDTATTLEVAIPIPYAPGVKASGKRLTVPAESWVYTSTNTAGTPLTGRGQYAEPINPTVKKAVDYGSGTQYVDTSFSFIRNGDWILVDGVGYRVISISTETRTYWPGLTRQYITLHFGTYNYPDYTELGTVGGWAYAYNTTPYIEDINKVTVYKLTWNNSTQQIVVTSSDKYLNELNIGDIVRYDGDAHTYEKIDYIDRTLYTDHYYYTGITTKIYQGSQISFVDMDTLVSQSGLTTSDNLRLTGGNVSIDTQMTGYGTRYIEFADSVAALNGKDITIQRLAETQPDLEYICAHSNRLWGVAGNKIYASAWGNPLVFTSDTQTAADPWSTEVGEDGEWTGIVSYSGAILAFKEHVMYRIIGSVPDEYTVYTYHVEGIKKGCHKSAVIIGEVLYYLGPNGVYAYAGSVPQRISANFGTREYSDGVGGTDGLRYYLSAKRGDAWDLHVLDVEKGIWLREDDTEIIDFADSDRPVVATTVTTDTGLEYTTNSEMFLLKTDNATGTYTFTYDAENETWRIGIVPVDLSEYGISVVEEPEPEPEEEEESEEEEPAEEEPEEEEEEEPVVPDDGDTIVVRVSGAGFYALTGRGETIHFNSGNETISWHVITAKLYEDIRTQYINIPIEHHSYSRFVIRIELDAGSTFNVEISYDGGDFKPCYKQLASRRQTYIVPIVPRRCDQMRIRLSGEGFFRLRGIVRVVHGGSAL